MSARILILSGIQLSTNPRVVKEADTLAGAGHDVEVVGALLEPFLGERDRVLHRGKGWKYTELIDAEATHPGARLGWLAARARRRAWRGLNARFGVENPNQLGYVAREMLRYALRNPADLTIVHNPQGVWAGAELIRHGRKVAVDMEDWYSEDVLAADASRYPVKSLKRWEKYALRGSDFSTTTSSRLSEALTLAYACSAPTVVYNSFSLDERKSLDGEKRDRRDLSLPSICWFSQVIGPSRGLETLMDALPDVDSLFEIHLRGRSTAEYRESLLARAPDAWRTRIYFHASIPHADLLPRIAEHDLGLAMEIPCNRSRELTITNKLPTYLLAGIPVLASETEGQKEAAGLAEGAIVIFPAERPRELAAALSSMLSDRVRLGVLAGRAALAAERVFCWEKSAPVILGEVARTLGKASRSQARAASVRTSPK